MAVLVTILAVVVALLVVLVAGLLRSHAEILRALHGLGAGLDPDEAPGTRSAPVGSPRIRAVPDAASGARRAADVSGVSPTGDAVSIAIVDVAHPTLVAFLTSGCSTCVEFWNTFAAPGLRAPGDARVVAVTKGPEAELPARLARFTTRDVPVVMSTDAWTDFDVPVAPYFVYVDGPTGMIVGEGAAGTWKQLSDMLEQAVEESGAPPRRGRRRSGSVREERADAALKAAGIDPGHPSLYPVEGAQLHAHDREH
jgi:hypothetical protein